MTHTLSLSIRDLSHLDHFPILANPGCRLRTSSLEEVGPTDSSLYIDGPV